MKDSGFEFIGDIPNTWNVARTKHITSKINSGSTPKGGSESYISNGIPIIRSQNVKNSGLDLSDVVFIPKITHKKMSNSQVKNGDVLLNITGASLGRCVFVQNIEEANVNQHVCIIRPYDWVSAQYLQYVLSSQVGQAQIFSSFTGSGREGLNFEAIKRFRLPFPNGNEQKAIANYLGKACKKIDKTIAIKQQQLEKINNFIGRKIDELILAKGKNHETQHSGKDFIGRIPKHYKVKKLKHLTTKIVDGTHFTPTYLDCQTDSDVPFLRVTDVQTRTINKNKVKYISSIEHGELIKRCNPEKGDMLLSKNGTIGITKLVDWDWPFSIFVSLCLIKANDLLNIEYLLYFFKSDLMKYQMHQGSKQITVTNLHLEKIREFYVVMPPSILEQEKIVFEIKEIEDKVDKIKSTLNGQITKLTQYRQSLIHECVTGKKRVYQGDIN